MSLCMNCNTHGADDMEVISNLIKIRLKPKVLLNHYMLCVRSVESLSLILKKKSYLYLYVYSLAYTDCCFGCKSLGSCSMHTETTWLLW